MTEYRFSVTARLITLGVCALVALMVLLFALGAAVGARLASVAPRSHPAVVTEIVPVAPVEGEEK